MSGSPHLRQVGARFSSAAARYDQEARLQARIARAVIDQIPADCRPSTILDIGCGTGGLTRLLRRRWSEARIDAVDLAPGMIARARREHAGLDIAWHVADAMAFTAPQPYDLVASSSALHWLVPVEAGMRHAASLVAPRGWLSAGLMLKGTLAELREARAAAVPDKPPPADMPEAADVRTALADSGLRIAHLREAQNCEFHATVRALLEGLHRLGVTGGALARGGTALTRGDLLRLASVYDERWRDARRGIPVTYHVGYVLARRP